MSDDFIIAAHALERFEERFPDLYEDDEQAARIIHDEYQDAIKEGRYGSLPPIELANNDLSRWQPSNNKGLVCWTPDKQRGYALLDIPEGQLVTTVLKGKEPDSARRMLYRDERRPREKGEENEANSP